jgi:hypothetical protein
MRYLQIIDRITFKQYDHNGGKQRTNKPIRLAIVKKNHGEGRGVGNRYYESEKRVIDSRPLSLSR